MNEVVWVKIDNSNYYKVLNKLNNVGITFQDIKKISDYILIKTTYEEYLKLKKYYYSVNISIYSYNGITKYKNIIKSNLVFIISVVIGICFLFLVNNMIFKIDVKTDNLAIKNLVLEELHNHNLKPFSLKRKHFTIEKIVEDILKDNKGVIEWLEIEYEGLVMNVYVTKTVNKNIVNDYKYCNVIATKDALIRGMNIYNGVALKEINDYVLKGDVILSGEVKLNEEIKDTVCASGKVYGEVWYKVKLSVPFREIKKVYTNKNRYNLEIVIGDSNYTVFKSRLDIFDKKITNLYQLKDFKINLIKEKEYVNKEIILSKEEAYNKGINLATEKILLLLDEDEEILLKKVLKNTTNNSTIYLEIFFVTKEMIGELQIVEGV